MSVVWLISFNLLALKTIAYGGEINNIVEEQFLYYESFFLA